MLNSTESDSRNIIFGEDTADDADINSIFSPKKTTKNSRKGHMKLKDRQETKDSDISVQRLASPSLNG